jgi:hypothetical protein
MTDDDGRDNGKKAGRKNPWERGRKTEENGLKLKVKLGGQKMRGLLK